MTLPRSATPDEWLAMASADAERRGLPDLIPILQTLAQGMAALRAFERESGIAARGGDGTARE